MRLNPTAVFLATTMLVVGGVQGASAAKVKSTIRITKAIGDEDGVRVRGVVTSGNALCKKRRRVKVYHDVDPEGPSPGDFLFDEALTDDDGKWIASTEFLPDKVYAKVVVKRLSERLTCRGAKSETEVVDFDD